MVEGLNQDYSSSRVAQSFGDDPVRISIGSFVR